MQCLFVAPMHQRALSGAFRVFMGFVGVFPYMVSFAQCGGRPKDTPCSPHGTLALRLNVFVLFVMSCCGVAMPTHGVVGNADGLSAYPSRRLRPFITANATLSDMDLSTVPGLTFGFYSFRGSVFDGRRVWLLPFEVCTHRHHHQRGFLAHAALHRISFGGF
jgi:hypothetical protein